ncbi:MAG: tRNA preQ1(34) S-adenosylmethionine ribosyltransferase-isomerase QueA [bacterium]
MRLEELDFDVPEGSIAQRPAEPRDSCRLMYLDRQGSVHHGRFFDLPQYLRPGDTLVLNDSRVLAARVQATKPTGGCVELLFLRPIDGRPQRVGEVWEVLARPSHRLRPGTELTVAGTQRLILRERLGEGRWLVGGPAGSSMVAVMDAHGALPLPPYIKTYPDDPSSYQTVYAAAPGSAAAPTAGLHFTPGLLERLRRSGVRSASVTLHVGLDTFQPIREPVVEEHRIHRETYSVSSTAVKTIRSTLQSGDRLVAVGTTTARVLETLATRGLLAGSERPGATTGSTEIFMTPGHRFQAVHVLLTNFHLPRSTVLALVMAFAGIEPVHRAYAEAIDRGYRFFSFGDAMLIEAPVLEEPGGRQSR